MTKGNVKVVAELLGYQRLNIYKAIRRFSLGTLLEQLRDAKTPDQIRIERARKELRSHG